MVGKPKPFEPQNEEQQKALESLKKISYAVGYKKVLLDCNGTEEGRRELHQLKEELRSARQVAIKVGILVNYHISEESRSEGRAAARAELGIVLAAHDR